MAAAHDRDNHDFDEVKTVIRNYTLRGRIGDLHHARNSGVCGVEDSQLRSAKTFVKWASILATVAARALRLTRRTEHSERARHDRVLRA